MRAPSFGRPDDSFAHCQRGIHKPEPLRELMVLPLQVGETNLMTELRSNLPLEVQSLDLAEQIKSSSPLDIETQQRCLLAIAAASRAPASASQGGAA